MDKQICNTCNIEKDLKFFNKDKKKRLGHSYQCKTCKKAARQVYEPTTQPQVCQKCNQMLPAEDFFVAKQNPTGRMYACKSCVAAATKPYSQDIANHKRIAKNKKFIRRYKKLCGCAHCGHKGHSSGVDLDLDHIDQAEKRRDTKNGSVIRPKMGRERIKEEIRKCQVLCANCHRIKTHTQNDYAYSPNDQ